MAKGKDVVCAVCDKLVEIDRETDVKVYVNCHGCREGVPKSAQKDKRGRLIAFRSQKVEQDARDAAEQQRAAEQRRAAENSDAEGQDGQRASA